MRVANLLGLVAGAMPLAGAMPATTYTKDMQERAMIKSADYLNLAPFNLTNVGVDCTRSQVETTGTMYDCELRFDWHDPNSVRENDLNSGTCISKWSWDGLTTQHGEKNTYDEQYSVCSSQLPTYFEMSIAGFNSSQDFQLAVAHHYKDSENFTEPWIYPTTFAGADIHLPIIRRNDTVLWLYDAGPIYANITDISD